MDECLGLKVLGGNISDGVLVGTAGTTGEGAVGTH